MRGVVMAGGEGTRLRPLTETVPKPFVRIGGRPVIEYGLDRLVQAGLDEIFITTFYKPERLISRLGGGTRLGASLFYSVEDEPLGTAGGVRKLAPFLTDTFVVISGDVLCDVDVQRLVAFHRASKAEATIALTEVPNPSEFGIVGLDERGRVTRFKEKPKPEEAFSNLINAGVYVLEPSVFDLVPDGEKFDFSKQLFPKLLEAGRDLYGARIEGIWMDVGRPSDLLRAAKAVRERYHDGKYWENGARVEGGGIVRETDLYAGAIVEAGAHVEGSILYEGARVAKGARVAGSVLGPHAIVEAGAMVEDCVLGEGARVGAGVKAHNERVASGASLTR